MMNAISNNKATVTAVLHDFDGHCIDMSLVKFKALNSIENWKDVGDMIANSFSTIEFDHEPEEYVFNALAKSAAVVITPTKSSYDAVQNFA